MRNLRPVEMKAISGGTYIRTTAPKDSTTRYIMTAGSSVGALWMSLRGHPQHRLGNAGVGAILGGIATWVAQGAIGNGVINDYVTGDIYGVIEKICPFELKKVR